MTDNINNHQLIQTSLNQIRYIAAYIRDIRSKDYREYSRTENRQALKTFKSLIKEHSLLINDLKNHLVDYDTAKCRLKSIIDQTPVYKK